MRLCVAAAVLLLAVSGCATRAKLERRRPARFSAGSARTLVLVQLTGHPELQRRLARGFRDEATGRDWWRVRDATGERIALFPDAGRGRLVRGRAPGADEVYVRLDAYEAIRTVEPVEREEREDDDGDDHDGPDAVERVRVRFAATLATAAGEALLRAREYDGTAATGDDDSPGRAALIRRAIARGMEDFFDDITPRRVREGIVLDKDAEDMRPIAELVARGQYAAAADRLGEMRNRRPRRADVVYNLAVVTDARGDYAAALDLYDAALSLGYKSYYAESRDACRRRLADREALGR